MNKGLKIFLIIFLVIIILLGITLGYIFIKYNKEFKQNIYEKGLVIDSVVDEVDETGMYIKINLIKKWFESDRWCALSSEENVYVNSLSWQKADFNVCKLKVSEEDKYIFLKDKNNNIKKFNIADYINKIIKFEVDVEDEIVLKGDKTKIKLNIVSIGNPDKTVKYVSSNENVAKVKNGSIIGIKDGSTKIEISDNFGHKRLFNITVTSLVRKATLNNNKPFLSANSYTEKEAKILDKILYYRVEKAGLKTRAGVVAAARFLTLEFKHKVPYFLENGRLFDNGYSDYIDGEGRYYHRGLYLSKDKYKLIKRSTTTPKYWGQYLIEYSEDRRIMKNGLDCSGFVVWAIVNGGFDPGDRGAGPNPGDEDIIDLGVSHRITLDYLKSGNVKAGDLIGVEGHIGIIIGVEKNYITVADTLFYELGLVATRFSFKDLINRSGFTHIYDMSGYYKKDGNYTAMWK